MRSDCSLSLVYGSRFADKPGRSSDYMYSVYGSVTPLVSLAILAMGEYRLSHMTSYVLCRAAGQTSGRPGARSGVGVSSAFWEIVYNKGVMHAVVRAATGLNYQRILTLYTKERLLSLRILPYTIGGQRQN